MRTLRLLGAGGAVTLGNVFYGLFQAVGLAIIARSAGGAVSVADFLLAQAIATPIGVFASSRLAEQTATDPVTVRYFLLVKSRLPFAAFGIAVTIAAVLLVDGQQRRWTIVFITISNLAQVLVDGYLGRRIRREQHVAAGVGYATLGLLSVTSIWLGLTLGGLVLASGFIAGSWTAFAVACLVHAELDDRRQVVTVELGASFRERLEIALASTAMILQPSISRIAVLATSGASALASFGTVSLLTRLGSLIAAGGRSVLSPKLADAILQEDEAVLIRKIRLGVRAFAVLGSVAAFVFGYFLGPAVITLLFSSSVAPSAFTAAFVLAGGPIVYGAMILNHAAVATNLSKLMLRAGLSGLVLTSLLVLPAGNNAGAEGVAVALLLGYTVRLIVLDHGLQVEGRRAICV